MSDDDSQTQPISGVQDDPTPTPVEPAAPIDSGAMTPPGAPPPPVPAAADGAATSDAKRPSVRDRLFGLRSVLAVAVASLLLGGVGGAALGAVSDGADADRRGPGGGGQLVPGQQGRPPGQGGQFPGQPGQLPGQGDGDDDGDGDGRLGGFQGQPPAGPQGQVPPGTVPQDDVVPDAGTGDSAGGTTT